LATKRGYDAASRAHPMAAGACRRPGRRSGLSRCRDCHSEQNDGGRQYRGAPCGPLSARGGCLLGSTHELMPCEDQLSLTERSGCVFRLRQRLR
jgi:hypothetical protein